MDGTATQRSWRVGLLLLVGLWIVVLLSSCVLPNVAPSANAGRDQKVSLGETIWVDGSQSFDLNNDQLSHVWTLTSRPRSSRAYLEYSDNPALARFQPDQAGTYVVQLVVNDGQYFSLTDSATIEVLEPVAIPLPRPYPGDGMPADHAQFTQSCGKCHGSYASAKPPKHVPAGDQCELCHFAEGWLPVRSDWMQWSPIPVPMSPPPVPLPPKPPLPPGPRHAPVQGECVACHDGMRATGKSDTHISASNSCESCHTINAWSPTARIDHTAYFGSCMACHNGWQAHGKSSNHLPSTNNCVNCHSVDIWSRVGVDHTQTVGTCASCHDGKMATGKSLQHLNTKESCDTCHNTSRWTKIVAVAPWQAPSLIAGQANRGSVSWSTTNADVAANGQQILDLRLVRNGDGPTQVFADLFYLKTPNAKIWEGIARSPEQEAAGGPVEVVQTNSGEIYAVWHNIKKVYVQQYVPGGGWLGANPLSALHSSFPVVALDVHRDNLGKVLVTWVRDTKRNRIVAVAGLDADGTWQTLPEIYTSSITNLTEVAATSLKNGSFAVVWNNFNRVPGGVGPDGLWGSVYTAGAGWASLAKIDAVQRNPRTTIGHVQIFAVGDGAKVVFSALRIGSGGGTPQSSAIYELTYGASGWGEAVALGLEVTVNGAARASANSKGEIVLAAFSANIGTQEAVLSVANYSAGAWTIADRTQFPFAFAENGTRLDITINEAGDALLAWTRHIPLQTLVADPNAYHKEVHARRYSAQQAKWGPSAAIYIDEPVAPKTVGIPAVSAGLDENGTAYVAWTALTGATATSIERVNVLTTQTGSVVAVKLR